MSKPFEAIKTVNPKHAELIMAALNHRFPDYFWYVLARGVDNFVVTDGDPYHPEVTNPISMWADGFNAALRAHCTL